MGEKTGYFNCAYVGRQLARPNPQVRALRCRQAYQILWVTMHTHVNTDLPPSVPDCTEREGSLQTRGSYLLARRLGSLGTPSLYLQEGKVEELGPRASKITHARTERGDPRTPQRCLGAVARSSQSREGRTQKPSRAGRLRGLQLGSRDATSSWRQAVRCWAIEDTTGRGKRGGRGQGWAGPTKPCEPTRGLGERRWGPRSLLPAANRSSQPPTDRRTRPKWGREIGVLVSVPDSDSKA